MGCRAVAGGVLGAGLSSYLGLNQRRNEDEVMLAETNQSSPEKMVNTTEMTRLIELAGKDEQRGNHLSLDATHSSPGKTTRRRETLVGGFLQRLGPELEDAEIRRELAVDFHEKSTHSPATMAVKVEAAAGGKREEMEWEKYLSLRLSPSGKIGSTVSPTIKAEKGKKWNRQINKQAKRPRTHSQMKLLCSCNATEILPWKPPTLFLHKTKPCISPSLRFKNPQIKIPLILNPSSEPKPREWRIQASAADHAGSAAMSEIDMARNREGVWSAKQNKVVVLWDLDNKPPRGPPYEAAMALREVAERFGDVLEMSAYANRHAFVHLPQWVLEERRERRRMDILERKGVSSPDEPYVCGVCGRKCRTNLDLKKHFKQLHERERQKKLNRMRSLKGKKRQKYKERFISGNHKYEDAARSLITPKAGYGLASELRRAGVFVKTVEDKPQSADWALKRQMQHSVTRGIDWMFLVSDDSDFSDMLRRARDSNLRTVVVGDWHRALGRHADLWIPWTGVENGEVAEEDLLSRTRRRNESLDRDDLFSISHSDGDSDDESDLDRFVDELAVSNSHLNGVRISAFSEGEEEEDWVSDELNKKGHGHRPLGQSLNEKDLLWDSEEEEDGLVWGAEVVQQAGMGPGSDAVGWDGARKDNKEKVVGWAAVVAGAGKRAAATDIVFASYKDTLWCDVVPTDVGHIILGRPWLFDKDVIIFGRSNTCSFIYEGRRIKLNPLPPKVPTIGKDMNKGESHEESNSKSLHNISLKESLIKLPPALKPPMELLSAPESFVELLQAPVSFVELPPALESLVELPPAPESLVELPS
ncbi:hypothetical protein HHK36_002623 [Tetracentron sinense]|uniref:C2H2-type domain-containing protein n=1 Tax=Tetracentron sinense TaxID=13715 RepID=A0A835DNH5_TETSI|nr:hypothetical protein HHK36_002623 [Tetracentron sinense]